MGMIGRGPFQSPSMDRNMAINSSISFACKRQRLAPRERRELFDHGPGSPFQRKAWPCACNVVAGTAVQRGTLLWEYNLCAAMSLSLTYVNPWPRAWRAIFFITVGKARRSKRSGGHHTPWAAAAVPSTRAASTPSSR